MTTVDRDASRLPLCFSCSFLENGSRSARESGQNRSNPRPRPILVVSLPSSSRGNVCTDKDGKTSGSVNGERVEKRERPIYIYIIRGAQRGRWSLSRSLRRRASSSMLHAVMPRTEWGDRGGPGSGAVARGGRGAARHPMVGCTLEERGIEQGGAPSPSPSSFATIRRPLPLRGAQAPPGRCRRSRGIAPLSIPCRRKLGSCEWDGEEGGQRGGRERGKREREGERARERRRRRGRGRESFQFLLLACFLPSHGEHPSIDRHSAARHAASRQLRATPCSSSPRRPNGNT